MTEEAKQTFEITAQTIANDTSIPLKNRQNIIENLKRKTAYELHDDGFLDNSECYHAVAFLDRVSQVLPPEIIERKSLIRSIFRGK